MAKDRSLDRHATPGFNFRFNPPELRDRLDAAMGARRRSWVLSRLVEAFLDGRPMPTVGELLVEWDKRGQGRGA
jgi:hypothetical protein